ncbi:hypothetical protein GQ53DRAFT_464507 [Thozetella sp. PMI_491]|nr:hypothetical protein GQ53DRAFT_464507 [Thozetella sp. PMI_491]
MDGSRRAFGTGIAHWLVAFLLVTAENILWALAGEAPRAAKQHPELTVLAYVTPWNPRGKDLVDEYREKFDIICPVWYTIHADEQAGAYEVKGAPPTDGDAEWYRQLQQASSTGADPVRVAPRFLLDGWDQADYQALIYNDTRWRLLSDSIVEVVEKMHYDGAVFESGATQALAPPLSVLADSLHAQHKILVIVSPPIRTATPSDGASVNAHNDMILGSIASLATAADYLSIMTYDMSGPVGRESTRSFPEGTPVRAAQQKGRVREPASNTNADWVKENLAAFMLAADPAVAEPEFGTEQQFRLEPGGATTTFLAGLPLYGYTYPVVFMEERTGRLLTQLPTSKDAAVAVLQGPGEPISTVDIQKLLEQHRAEVLEAHDGEYFFDYVKGNSFWRTFLPTQESMAHTIATALALAQDELHSPGNVGVALWEVGQSSPELLSTL